MGNVKISTHKLLFLEYINLLTQHTYYNSFKRKARETDEK